MTIGQMLAERPVSIQPNVAYPLSDLFDTLPTANLKPAPGIDFSSTSTQGWSFSAIFGAVQYPSDLGASEGYTLSGVSPAGTQYFEYDGVVNGEPGIDFVPLSSITITFSHQFLASHPSFALQDVPGLSLNTQDQFASTTFGGGVAYESSYNPIPVDYLADLTADLSPTTPTMQTPSTIPGAPTTPATPTPTPTPMPVAIIPNPSPTTGFSGMDATDNQPVAVAPQQYSGPVSDVQEQFVDVTHDNLNISVSTPNWFIHSGAGNDAIAASNGINALDGGTGSNFLTGGSGTDTFFVDDRGATADIWSTVSGFHAGDAATIWGVTPQNFSLAWVNGQGAAGYTGLTLHATSTGKPTASLTLVGYTNADLSNGRLSVNFGTDPGSGSSYMYVHSNS
jgi:hypothetical protein